MWSPTDEIRALIIQPFFKPWSLCIAALGTKLSQYGLWGTFYIHTAVDSIAICVWIYLNLHTSKHTCVWKEIKSYIGLYNQCVCFCEGIQIYMCVYVCTYYTYICFKFSTKEPSKQDFFSQIVPDMMNPLIDFHTVWHKLPGSNSM